MLSVFFVFTVLSGVIAEKEYDCDAPTTEECPLAMQFNFPKEREEFEQFCNSMSVYLECRLAVEEQCQRHPEFQVMVNKVYPVLLNACGGDALLHAAILDNLRCFGELIETPNVDCHESRPTEVKLQQYLTRLNETSLMVPDRNMDDTRRCLEEIHIHACSILKVKRVCGTVAKVATVEIIRKMPAEVFAYCGEEIINYLPTIVLLHELEEEELENIEQALEKK